ncbi:MAG: HDOD domain-containing protein [Opitutaceae bacterium]|nr:HDOD domain-containing protein [Opitutaceae bacterium]
MSPTQESIITLGNKLAPAAATFSRLRQLLLDPDVELHEIVSLIRLDPALTFHVVRMSNSVLFGVREKTDSLDVAVGRVGLGEIFRLVGLAAVSQVCQRDLATYRLPATRLWENAVATAAAADLLAQRANIDAGLAYTAGLLRSVGRVILDGSAFGLVYPGAAEWPSVAEWEKKTFGVTSSEVTTTLLSHWRFPGELVEAVSQHYEPLGAEGPNMSACVLNLACGVAARFGLELPGEEGDWECTPAKLTLAGITEEELEDCSNRARAHFVLLCSSVV